MENRYYPEGDLLSLNEDLEYISSLQGLERAMTEGRILEATVSLCDSDLCLHVDLGGIHGIIEREECVFCRRGESVKDIAVITRVGKPVAFKVIGFRQEKGETVALLSRKAAQAECQQRYVSALRPGDIIPARVTHLESFGAFVDIGCGLSSLLTVDSISVSRISHPRDRLSVGENIFVVVKSREENAERVYVSMKELLGTWAENASDFSVGQTVPGIVRSIEDYGVFVELTPNLAGLAEPKENVQAGQQASVYIKNLIPEKMKVKLIIIDSFDAPYSKTEPKYFIDSQHIDRFVYSPKESSKIIETVF